MFNRLLISQIKGEEKNFTVFVALKDLLNYFFRLESVSSPENDLAAFLWEDFNSLSSNSRTSTSDNYRFSFQVAVDPAHLSLVIQSYPSGDRRHSSRNYPKFPAKQKILPLFNDTLHLYYIPHKENQKGFLLMIIFKIDHVSNLIPSIFSLASQRRYAYSMFLLAEQPLLLSLQSP